MIIESKKTKHQTVISPEEWEEFKKKGYNLLFKVVSESKEILKEEKGLPLAEVQEFQIIKEKTKPNKKIK